MTFFAILVPVILLMMIGVLLTISILSVKRCLSPTGDLAILINEEKEEIVPSGGTLLESLLKLGYGIPAPCGGKATCHQCKVKVKEGGGDPCEVETMVFPPKKIKEGWRLSCQCKVRESLKIDIAPASMSVSTFKAKVVSNHNVSTFIKELCVQLPEGEKIEYIPGDYMQFHIPSFSTHTKEWQKTMEEKYHEVWHNFQMFDREIKSAEEGELRAYSMASYPKEGNILKFTVRIATPPFRKGAVHQRIKWGLGSSYIFSLKEGEEIELSGPYGESHMIEDDRELVFLIGGAGASFGRAHIMDLFYGKNTSRKVTLWYGARSMKENIYQEEFEKLDQEFDNFSYRLVLSEPTDKDFEKGWPKQDTTKTGFAGVAFEEGQLKDMDAPEDALYYICGPPGHNASILKLLYDYGVEKDTNIILDDFGN